MKTLKIITLIFLYLFFVIFISFSREELYQYDLEGIKQLKSCDTHNLKIPIDTDELSFIMYLIHERTHTKFYEMQGYYHSYIINDIIYSIGDIITIGRPSVHGLGTFCHFFTLDGTEFIPIMDEKEKLVGREIEIVEIELVINETPEEYYILVTLKDIKSSQLYYANFEPALLEGEIY